jgi:hypothetical protein
MQLKNNTAAVGLRAGLMAAACALLSPATRAQVPVAGESTGTQIDTGLLYYQEDKGRVRSVDAIVKLTHDFGDERLLGVQLAVDSLSGGSPNGAIASHSVQTFATPSSGLQSGGGGGEDDEDEGHPYTVAAGRQPLVAGFKDLRVAADLSWSQPLGVGNRLSVGGHLSKEYDFLSVSANGSFSHDFNNKNTTLGLGLSTEFDQIKAVGGTPVPGSDYALQSKTRGNETKKVYGAQLGLTQVLARNWITQLNLSVDRGSGYLGDPYKILSRVDGTGNLLGYQYESRPDSHTRRSVYLGNKVALGRSVLDLSLRLGTDDWGIGSKTAEMHYRIPLRGRMYIEPQLRWYQQDAADFYRLYLTSADPVTSRMSADPRLGAFTAKTVGLKLGIPRSNGDEIGLRLEAYQQDPKQQYSNLAALNGLDLNPRLRAMVLQFDWRFGY